MAILQDVPLAKSVLSELGDQDFTAADFFEAYAEAIEQQAQAQHQMSTVVTDEVRGHLLHALGYFDNPASDYRLWPQEGLRAFAMLAPLHVASGVLGPSQDLLQLAIRSQRPNKSWAWWRALGVAILADASDEQIMTGFDLTLRAVHKYRRFLIGRSAARKVA